MAIVLNFNERSAKCFISSLHKPTRKLPSSSEEGNSYQSLQVKGTRFYFRPLLDMLSARNSCTKLLAVTKAKRKAAEITNVNKEKSEKKVVKHRFECNEMVL